MLERDETRRQASVHKIVRSLDRFLSSYDDDGGCDEGPGYWFRAGGSLFDCLELLDAATAGKINVYSDPLVGEIGRYIYRAHISDDYFINFAYAGAKMKPNGDLLYRYGRRIGDEKLQAFGAYAAVRGGDRPDSIARQVPAVLNMAAMRKAPQSQPLLRDMWMRGIQVMAARCKEGSARGLYVAAKGGHNAESHNHKERAMHLTQVIAPAAALWGGPSGPRRTPWSAHRQAGQRAGRGRGRPPYMAPHMDAT